MTEPQQARDPDTWRDRAVARARHWRFKDQDAYLAWLGAVRAHDLQATVKSAAPAWEILARRAEEEDVLAQYRQESEGKGWRGLS